MKNAPAVAETLKTVFGFETFRSGQEAVIEHILVGRSALAVFPTGSGKSLCYQLPALHLAGLTLVVSPLIALMKDQIDFLVGKGVRAARLDSSLEADEARAVWDDLWAGRLKLLYIAPERFASERFLEQLRRAHVSLMVVDEAHCISEWGHNFRPDYMKLARLAKDVGVERVLALTATATPPVAADICKSFGICPEAYIHTGFHRPNLMLRVTPCTPTERNDLLVKRLQADKRGAGIVYVTLQKTAEAVAETLVAKGVAARAYHAGLDPEERNAVQDAFMAGSDAVVVATIAFGMGIDKADIRFVYHYNPPKSLENYMQEIGRAGRDGKPADCEVFYCPEDLITLENFSYGDTPSLEAIEGMLQELHTLPDTFDISVYELSSTYDVRPLVVSTLLTYLELDGVLASTGPLYSEYKFQTHRPAKEIFGRFDADRAQFLERVFGEAKLGRTWMTLDLAAASKSLSEPRERIIKALNFLEEKGDLTVRVAGLRHGYRFLQRPAESGECARSLWERFRASERRDLERIRRIDTLASAEGCLVRQLLDYFGEDLGKDCGHCGPCLGEIRPSLPPPPAIELQTEESASIHTLIGERHAALASARQLARFLCGITSPATIRAKLTKDARFGSLAHHRFAVVARAAKEALGAPA